MTTTWIAQLAAEQLPAVAALRMSEGVDALAMGGVIYLRGTCDAPEWDARAGANDDAGSFIECLPPAIRALPGKLYRMLDDEQLVEHQARTPTAKLPIGYWAPLAEFVRVELPQAGLDAELPEPVWLRLVRDPHPAAPNLLMTRWHLWRDYAETAAESRLHRLRFARDGQGGVLVHGQPLPPLPGTQWVERSGMATPAGWSWLPPLDAEVVAQAFRVPDLSGRKAASPDAFRVPDLSGRKAGSPDAFRVPDLSAGSPDAAETPDSSHLDPVANKMTDEGDLVLLHPDDSEAGHWVERVAGSQFAMARRSAVRAADAASAEEVT